MVVGAALLIVWAVVMVQYVRTVGIGQMPEGLLLRFLFGVSLCAVVENAIERRFRAVSRNRHARQRIAQRLNW